MADHPFSQDIRTFRFTAVSVGALTGGVIAFAWSGAIAEVLWTLLGIALGAAVGLGLRAVGHRAQRVTQALPIEPVTERAAQVLELGDPLEPVTP